MGGIAASDAFYARLRVAGENCGITRLAEITGLDRLGLPVWQAVRPAGWSLSVHQGKGATALHAKIGALCEAIEAHCAERAPADGPVASFAALPEGQRAPELGDYCRNRGDVPAEDEPIRWCTAADLASGGAVYLPHALVSLDYRSGLPSPIERVSSGLGAGPSEEEAVRTALLEIVERDAVGEWQRLPPERRMGSSLALGSVPYPWLREWRERLADLAVDIQLLEIPSVIDVPTYMCVIGASGEFSPGYRRFSGTAAHPHPEIALFKAFAEAIQSRLTLIAGVRDDILPSYYERHEGARRPRGWPPAGARAWREVEPAPAGVQAIVDRLTTRGYRQIAVKRLDRGLEGIAVARAFVPGLGSLTRARRAPA
jgi:ribosomal protein S12 methylthiotransferase accessory factor